MQWHRLLEQSPDEIRGPLGRRDIRRYRFPQGADNVGIGARGNTGGGQTTTQPPAVAPPSYQSNLDAFIQFLNGNQFGKGGQNQYFVDAANNLLAQSQGVNPLFDQYREAQLGLLGQQQGQQQAQLQSYLAQHGVSGSAGLNEINKLNAGFNAQGQALSGQIGLQGLDFANQALQNSLSARSAAITQAGFPAGLDIAGLAAHNAGQGGSSGGGGMGTILCTYLWKRGDLPSDIYRADKRYAQENIDADTWAGYYAWARHAAYFCHRHEWFYRLTRPLARAWAYEMAYRVGAWPESNWKGRALMRFGAPLCRSLGKTLFEMRCWRMRFRAEVT